MESPQTVSGWIMNYPAAELRGIWNTEYSCQKSEFFFEDILINLLNPEFWILTPRQSFKEFF